jgi:hypothetical protein
MAPRKDGFICMHFVPHFQELLGLLQIIEADSCNINFKISIARNYTITVKERQKL